MKYFIIIKDQSERVPNKNFRLIGDKPLWRVMVDKFQGEEVFINTDSERVLEDNLSWVNSYKRSQKHIDMENTADVSPVLSMIEEFLDNYVEDENEIIVTPHVTSPFITKETIEKASELIGEYDSVQACTEHKEFSYFQEKPINFNLDVVQRTQDLEPIVMGNGAFFIFTKKSFKEHKNRVATNNKFYPLNSIEAIEIDYEEDFNLADIVFNGLTRKLES